MPADQHAPPAPGRDSLILVQASTLPNGQAPCQPFFASFSVVEPYESGQAMYSTVHGRLRGTAGASVSFFSAIPGTCDTVTGACTAWDASLSCQSVRRASSSDSFDAMQILALGAVVIALGVTCWLVRDRDARSAPR